MLRGILSFSVQARGLDPCCVLTSSLLQCHFSPCRRLLCSLLPFSLQARGLLTRSLGSRRFVTSGLGPCCLQRLRARGAGRRGDDGRRHRWGGGHDPRGFVGLLHGDHGRRRGRRGRGVNGHFGAQGRFRIGYRAGGVFLWNGLRRRLGLGRDHFRRPPRWWRAGYRWRRGRPADSGRLDRCRLPGLHDRQGCRRGSRDRRRNEHHTQVGHLDKSISRGGNEARKPGFLVAESQAQQQRVNHQGEQQRTSQSPSFAAHQMTQPLHAACGLGRSHRLRVRVNTRAAGPRANRACSAAAAGASHLARGGRAAGHDLAKAPRTRSHIASGPLSTPCCPRGRKAPQFLLWRESNDQDVARSARLAYRAVEVAAVARAS